MEETLIEFETAKLAFEKGLRRKGEIFSEGKTFKVNLEGVICENCFNLEGKSIRPKYTQLTGKHIPRPTQSLLQTWLRQTHGIKVWCEPHEFSSSDGWAYNMLARREGLVTVSKVNQASSVHLTYEQALEEGLLEALKHIPEK